MTRRFLIIEKSAVFQKLSKEFWASQAIEAVYTENHQTAISLMKISGFDAIITDHEKPFISAQDTILAAKTWQTKTPVIIASNHDDVEMIVSMLKLGAFDFVKKPHSEEACQRLISKIQNHINLQSSNFGIHQNSVEKSYPFVIAKSPSMKKILSQLEKIAQSSASVFITGESGTGKEVIGGLIHNLSLRKAEPFVKVNCAAIAQTLIESELFGHEKGSFTGAFQKKIGRFEMADLGTFLLDEVTEIPLNVQAKLLRVIQEMEFERVGGTKSIKVNIRFIATSNRSMQEAIDTKMFREDLYYRLNVVPIHIPSLRDRKEDILPLANFFLEKFCRENLKPLKTLTSQAQEKLLSYSWPGNVRELSNIIERAVVMDFDDRIEHEHLYLDFSQDSKNIKTENSCMTLYAIEKHAILDAFERNGRNKTKTAQSLGISIRTLRNKLHEYETPNID